MLDEAKVPSKSFLEKKLDSVEKGDLKAEKLSDVTNVNEDDGTDLLQTVWDPSGNLAAVKRAAKCDLPKNPEELRFRMTLLGTAWAFVGFHQSNRDYLKGLTHQTWQEYLDYLLGRNVWQLCAKGIGGLALSTSPWDLIISYEHEIRVQAYRLVQRGLFLAEALKKSWEDPVLKERCFTTPLALSVLAGHKRRTPDTGFDDGTAHDHGYKQKIKKGDGKGKRGKGQKGDNKSQRDDQ